MAKKSDLEASFREYSARRADAARAEAGRDYARMLKSAVSTLSLAREAIAYLRRYQKVPAPRLPAIDQILRYAPPMFARKSLDAVDQWLAQVGRAERKVYSDLPNQLQASRQLLALATRVWPSWRPAGPALASGDNPVEVSWLFEFWVASGAVVRYVNAGKETYQLVTHPRRQAQGKCFGCGHVMQADLQQLLEPTFCFHCRTTSPFAIVGRIA